MLLLLLQGGSTVVTAEGATQANTSTAGAVVQFYALAADGVAQANTSAAGAVGQTHLLQCDAVDASNASNAGAILQVHLLQGENASQNNNCKELIYYGTQRGRSSTHSTRPSATTGQRLGHIANTRLPHTFGVRSNKQTSKR